MVATFDLSAHGAENGIKIVLGYETWHFLKNQYVAQCGLGTPENEAPPPQSRNF